jgi:putative sigma-54 modulation protein
MNLSVTGHHLSVTPALRTYLESKLERILRHFDHVIDVSVILSVEKLRQRAEVTLHARAKDIFVEVDHQDMYAAIDTMIDKLDRAVLKHKQRTYAHPRDSLRRDVPTT